jgi:hypothetical protein
MTISATVAVDIGNPSAAGAFVREDDAADVAQFDRVFVRVQP